MWLQALTAAGGWAYEIFKGKQAVVKAKVDGQIQRVQRWEDRMAEASISSWRDEFWTIILAIPMILSFFPEMVPHVKAGFEALDEMPEWYRWAVMLSIASSFGFRGFDKYTLMKGK